MSDTAVSPRILRVPTTVAVAVSAVLLAVLTGALSPSVAPARAGSHPAASSVVQPADDGSGIGDWNGQH